MRSIHVFLDYSASVIRRFSQSRTFIAPPGRLNMVEAIFADKNIYLLYSCTTFGAVVIHTINIQSNQHQYDPFYPKRRQNVWRLPGCQPC
jgi:hypothetical protein